jgi:hypothetical protein
MMPNGPPSQVQIPRLAPKDLYNKRVKRDQARLKTYNQLLEQIYTRVYSTSQMSGNANYILYTVPPFVLGLPRIDMEDCIVYLVYMLRQHGYEVRFTYPNLLYISWKHHEKDYLLHQNPIVQAMLPPEDKKADKNKKSKVSFRSTVEVSNAMPPGYGQDPRYLPPVAPQMEQKPIRRASEYTPPASFMNTMQKPLPEKKENNILADLWNFT